MKLMRGSFLGGVFSFSLIALSALAIEPTTNVPSSAGATPEAHATMNDHDKMVEACNGVHGKDKCNQMLKSCEGEKDQTLCMHKHMKKHH